MPNIAMKYIDMKLAHTNSQQNLDTYIANGFVIYYSIHKIIENIMNGTCHNIKKTDFDDVNRGIKYINNFSKISKMKMFDMEKEKDALLKEMQLETGLARTQLQAYHTIQIERVP